MISEEISHINMNSVHVYVNTTHNVNCKSMVDNMYKSNNMISLITYIIDKGKTHSLLLNLCQAFTMLKGGMESTGHRELFSVKIDIISIVGRKR